MEKQRVDVLLVTQGLFETREKAKRAVMAGEVLGNNEERLDKPGVKIPIDTDLHIKGKPLPYVSRGGLKLAKALKVFDISVQDKIVLDIGSSTGGFTDVMLQMVQNCPTHSMLGAISSSGNYVRMSAWWSWNTRTFGTVNRMALRTDSPRSPRSMSPLFRCH